MRKIKVLAIHLVPLCLLCIAGPATANALMEPTFEEKLADSTSVIIGTVTAVDRGGQSGRESTATLTVSHTLKGERNETITVRTYHPADELNPRCCVSGATYIMFLRPSASDGKLVSAWGVYGMIRIGGPPGRSVRATSRGTLELR